MRRDKEKILKELEAAVAKCNEIKKRMVEQIKVLEEKKRTFNVESNVLVLDVEDLEYCDDSIAVLDRKINLLSNAVKAFRYSNYDFYRDKASSYINMIYGEIDELDNKIENSLTEAEKAVVDAEKALEEMKMERIPAMRFLIAEKLSVLGEEIDCFWYGLKGTQALNNLRRRIEK